MSVDVLIMTDGRDDLLDQTIASARSQLQGDIRRWWIHDDSGSYAHRQAIADRHADVTVIGAGRRLGFGGAIDNAWRILGEHSRGGQIFHLEDDFLFNRPVSLDDMSRVLEFGIERRTRGYSIELAQVALVRQAWNDEERLAGGLIQSRRGFTERTLISGGREIPWMEHREFFTTNPCMYEWSLMRRGWPRGANSEGHFGIYLRDRGYVFGFMGHKDDEPWVHHIGTERVGKGY